MNNARRWLRQAPPTHFKPTQKSTAFFALGAGYYTNPSATPRDNVLTLRSGDPGLIEEIALGFTREESPLAFVQAGVRVAAPLDGRTTAVFDFSGYAAHFFDDNDQDDAIIALRMGPEIVYAKGVFRPFLDLGYRHFGSDPYAVAAALGVEASVDFGPGVLTMELSGGYRDFIPTRDTPGRENLDGTEAQVALSYGVPLSQALQLDVSARVAAVNADKDFEDYFAFGADAALSATFDAFGRPLVATLGGGVVTSRYETADFQLLDIKRRDTSVAAYFGLATDLDEVTSIDGAVTYRRRFSN